MKTFIGTKIIQAEPQAKTDGPTDTHGQPGYKVVYPDGYTSWSPAAAFEEAYRETTGMPFGLAVEALKKGRRVARMGWNGKGMWLELVSANGYSVGCSIPCVTETNEFGMIRRLPWIGMKTADNGFVPWLASQTDMLADDWMILMH